MSDRPFRFYDNRQKYLGFVTTCNEKWKIAERAVQELSSIEPKLPAFHIYDAGMGDGTVLGNVMRAVHQHFPTVPMLVVGKEISLEDIRLCLEKLPDRFVEHPAMVVVFTNLYYAEAPWLRPRNPASADKLNWITLELSGRSAYEYGEQLGTLESQLVDGWQVRASPKTGNPLYVRPSVLVMYRRDYRFLLEPVLAHCRANRAEYDLILAAQAWRARMSADFKVQKVLGPVARSLRPGGRALVVQSCGRDPGIELIREIWPDEDPFQVDRHALIKALTVDLGREVDKYQFDGLDADESIFQFEMHTLPDEIAKSIGTSTLFAAWNAAIYVAQIEDARLEQVVSTGRYLEATAKILKKYNGLWFNDEAFVVARRE